MWHYVADMRGLGANGPDIDGVHGARGDSDLTCIAWSSWAQCLGLDIHSGFSKHSLLPKANFPRCSSFLPFLVHNMRQTLYEVRSQHTCFLRNHLLLFTLREHYFINPLWISRSNTRIFVSKVVWWCNLVKVLGQQSRY